MNLNTIILGVIFISSCNLKNEGTKVKTKENKVHTTIKDSFLCAYELSPKTIAVAINFNEGEEHSFFDSLFSSNAIKIKKNKVVDSSGQFIFMKDENLEKIIKKTLQKEIYIYGTKGVSLKNTISDVYYETDECKTNMIALVINFDARKYGHPLLYSNKIIDLKFGSNYKKIERKIEQFYNSEKSDYTDTVKTKVFANADSLYFTYNDDFKWGNSKIKTKCLFPARSIFALQKNGQVKRVWSNDLDLFGISCD